MKTININTNAREELREWMLEYVKPTTTIDGIMDAYDRIHNPEEQGDEFEQEIKKLMNGASEVWGRAYSKALEIYRKQKEPEYTAYWDSVHDGWEEEFKSGMPDMKDTHTAINITNTPAGDFTVLVDRHGIINIVR